jgi:hypothetical protein
VLSHGSVASDDSARDLYDAMFPLIAAAAAGSAAIGRAGFAGVHWPSLWFPLTPATPATGRPGAELSAGTQALSGADISAALLPGFPAGQQEVVSEIGRCIDDGVAGAGSNPARRIEHIHRLLQCLAPPPGTEPGEDDGEDPLVRTSDPVTAYQDLARVFGTAPAGGDWFGRAISGAKDAVRVVTCDIMKARAGGIGRTGLGPMLTRLHERSPALRVHLIGHGFGARLVSFALAGIGSAAGSPVSSLSLLQGTFSHWSFAHAQDNPFGRPGALHAVADRVHGPLVSTYSVYDWAVGVWYPKASFLSRPDTEAFVVRRWGGMGADGFQAVDPLEVRIMPAGGDRDYRFKPGTFYRVNAANVINDVRGRPFAGAHSDIRKAPIARLLVDAASAHT